MTKDDARRAYWKAYVEATAPIFDAYDKDPSSISDGTTTPVWNACLKAAEPAQREYAAAIARIDDEASRT